MLFYPQRSAQQVIRRAGLQGWWGPGRKVTLLGGAGARVLWPVRYSMVFAILPWKREGVFPWGTMFMRVTMGDRRSLGPGSSATPSVCGADLVPIFLSIRKVIIPKKSRSS